MIEMQWSVPKLLAERKMGLLEGKDGLTDMYPTMDRILRIIVRIERAADMILQFPMSAISRLRLQDSLSLLGSAACVGRRTWPHVINLPKRVL